VGNTSSLSATRTFNPTTDYTGSITVSNATVFVPPVLSVYYGSQGTGYAYVTFGGIKCTYQGNNKSGSALALYEFLHCVDGETSMALGPGQPFPFTGTITLAIGDGSGTTSPIQVLAFLQVQ
jgi:hypothetical protein